MRLCLKFLCIGRSLTVPNFENASLEELAVAMGCSPSRQAALRTRAIWALAKGMARDTVALFCNVHEHTLIEWIKRFNEEGIEGDPRPRKRWVEKGSKPTIPYAGTHLRRNVIGAVCPQTGCLSTLIFSHCNTEIFQIFLDNLASEIPFSPDKRRLLIFDNASWHKSKALNWHHFEPIYLPPYSPDFNPIERFWLRLKSDFFADFFAKKVAHLEERIVLALQAFFAQPGKVKSNCAISGNF